MKAQPYETLAAAERRILQGGQTGEVMAVWAGPVAGGRYGHPRLMASGVERGALWGLWVGVCR